MQHARQPSYCSFWPTVTLACPACCAVLSYALSVSAFALPMCAELKRNPAIALPVVLELHHYA